MLLAMLRTGWHAILECNFTVYMFSVVSVTSQLERQLAEMEAVMRASDSRGQDQLRGLEKNNKLLNSEKDCLAGVSCVGSCLPPRHLNDFITANSRYIVVSAVAVFRLVDKLLLRHLQIVHF